MLHNENILNCKKKNKKKKNKKAWCVRTKRNPSGKRGGWPQAPVISQVGEGSSWLGERGEGLTQQPLTLMCYKGVCVHMCVHVQEQLLSL